MRFGSADASGGKKGIRYSRTSRCLPTEPSCRSGGYLTRHTRRARRVRDGCTCLPVRWVELLHACVRVRRSGMQKWQGVPVAHQHGQMRRRVPMIGRHTQPKRRERIKKRGSTRHDREGYDVRGGRHSTPALASLQACAGGDVRDCKCCGAMHCGVESPWLEGKGEGDRDKQQVSRTHTLQPRPH